MCGRFCIKASTCRGNVRKHDMVQMTLRYTRTNRHLEQKAETAGRKNTITPRLGDLCLIRWNPCCGSLSSVVATKTRFLSHSQRAATESCCNKWPIRWSSSVRSSCQMLPQERSRFSNTLQEPENEHVTGYSIGGIHSHLISMMAFTLAGVRKRLPFSHS